MDTLPPELILSLVRFFPLASLIAARGVNTQWRSLAQTASLYPTRKTLLDLYLAAIAHPNFPSLATVLQPHVREFDREAYIADLISRGCVLPDLFELWVLEWPSKAVHFWAWPGLVKDPPINHECYCGWGNVLGDPMPTIRAIPVPKEEATSVWMTCQGLALWEAELWFWGGVVRLYLVVDANESINDRLAGRLVWAHSYYDDAIERTGPEHNMRLFYNAPFVADDLIAFLDLLDLDRGPVAEALKGYYFGAGIRFVEIQ